MNWYIGQEIVCVRSQSQGYLKRGQVFTIKGLRDSFCNCKIVLIDVGIREKNSHNLCGICNIKSFGQMDIGWFAESFFAPLEYNQDAINELLEEPILVEK